MKHRQVGQQLLLALLLVLLSSTSLAMRCGNRLIQEGDTKLEVLRKCGQPSFVEGSGVIEREEEVIAADQLGQTIALITCFDALQVGADKGEQAGKAVSPTVVVPGFNRLTTALLLAAN